MNGKTKLKLLYIKDYLERYSDEENPVSADELMQMLAERGIACERKSVYSDIGALREYGLDIFRVKSPKNGYCIGRRDFEIPELSLLIDAVSAADFISAKKTSELIGKICLLCSNVKAKQLENRVYINNRTKCTNEQIYYNIDVISRAIEEGKQISFIYGKRTFKKGSAEIVREEKKLVMNPYALIWSDDHYYLVGNNPKYNNLMHVRIDRMRNVEKTKRGSRHFSQVCEYTDFFDTADYSAKLFGMFSGESVTLKLLCNCTIVEELLDRFGETAHILKTEDRGKFLLTAEAVIGEGLISWIMQFGADIEVLSPESLRQQIQSRALQIAQVYQG